MSEKIFYVYEWYNIDTGEVFYVGKGCNKRYKTTYGRNKDFLKYINTHNVDSRIVYNDLEEKIALSLEKELTDYYKTKNQCSCNIAPAGKGGTHFGWSPELREYLSKYNPMKEEAQRERMRLNNPMKNKEIAMKNGKSHKKQVQIGDILFDGIKDASEYYNVSTTTISNWAMKGKTPNNIPCFFPSGEIKTTKKGKSIIIDGIYYTSINKGAMAIGVSSSALRQALNEKRAIKGHSCEYANQQPSQ